MQRIPTTLPDVFLLQPRVFEDERGFFMETFNLEEMRGFGIGNEFVQDNHSLSRRGTVRGLHYQLEFPQAKLCRVIQGEVWDIAVDIRHGSPTFGQWTGVLLSAENKLQVFVPRGFAHGFAVLSETAEFLYKCDDIYHREDEHGIAWNDPALGIDWKIANPVLSARDQLLPRLDKVDRERLPAYEQAP